MEHRPGTKEIIIHEVDGIHTNVVEFCDGSAMIVCQTAGDVVRMGSLSDEQHKFGFYSVNKDLPVSRDEAQRQVGLCSGEEPSFYNNYRAIAIGCHDGEGLPVTIVVDGEYITRWEENDGNKVTAGARRMTNQDRIFLRKAITIGDAWRWAGGDLVVEWLGRPFGGVGGHRDGSQHTDMTNPFTAAQVYRNGIRAKGVVIK